MLIKVSGPIKLRRALELIEILMEKHGVAMLNNYAEQDFYMPYEDTQALIEKGLIFQPIGELIYKNDYTVDNCGRQISNRKT